MIEVYHLKATGLARVRSTPVNDHYQDITCFGENPGASLADVWRNPDYWRPFGLSFEKVALVRTDDMDLAFERTNHISRPWSENPDVQSLAPNARSTSVGDVVVRQGVAHYVASVGFPEVPPCAIRSAMTEQELTDALDAARATAERAAAEAEQRRLAPPKPSAARSAERAREQQNLAVVWGSGARDAMSSAARLQAQEPDRAERHRGFAAEYQVRAQKAYQEARRLLGIEGDVLVRRESTWEVIYACDTVAEAQAYLTRAIQMEDRAGLEAGHYVIDAPADSLDETEEEQDAAVPRG